MESCRLRLFGLFTNIAVLVMFSVILKYLFQSKETLALFLRNSSRNFYEPFPL